MTVNGICAKCGTPYERNSFDIGWKCPECGWQEGDTVEVKVSFGDTDPTGAKAEEAMLNPHEALPVQVVTPAAPVDPVAAPAEPPKVG